MSVVRETIVGRRDGRLAGERVVGSACGIEGVIRGRQRSACGRSCRRSACGIEELRGGSGRLAGCGRSIGRPVVRRVSLSMARLTTVAITSSNLELTGRLRRNSGCPA